MRQARTRGPARERGCRRLCATAVTWWRWSRLSERSKGAALGFEHIGSGFLAVDENGTPQRRERWSDMGRTHCQTGGGPVVTSHSACHSSVTALGAAGVSDDVVAAWHGHDETIMRADLLAP